MKKIPLYLAIAVFLGLLITLVPLLAFVELNVGNYSLTSPESVSNGFRGIEGSHGSTAAKLSFLDVEVPMISFAVAIAAYLLVRREIG